MFSQIRRFDKTIVTSNPGAGAPLRWKSLVFEFEKLVAENRV
jgi:hypothetical protein